MNMTKLFVVFAISGLLASSANASYKPDSRIIHMIPNAFGMVLFKTEGTKSGSPPACDTAQRWSINATTSTGQIQASALMSAFYAGKIIYVVGTGTCTNWGDTENVDYFIVYP